jgi:hypothetical protein
VSELRDRAWLQRALNAVDLVFFESHCSEYPVTIKWMPWKPAKPGAGFLYATYCEGLILVNRTLAWGWVPDFVVVGTVYHEALHHIVGMEHDLAFKYAEHKFPHYTDAALWEQAHHDKLVNAQRPF